MSTSTPSTSHSSAVQSGSPSPSINDVVIQIATSNGSGSQSSNGVLLRSIFQMGVPVSGKNIFPSNIQGLPTWYTIRVNKDGWVAQKREIDVLIAMNNESIVEDLKNIRPGGTVILHSDLQSYLTRNDLNVHIVPYGELVAKVCPEVKFRKLVVNMIYVGVAGYLLSIDLEEIKSAIQKQFKSKPKAAELNINAVISGFNWASEHLVNDRQFVIERMERKEDLILVDGNYSTALGMLYGGVTVVGWYPITPSSSVCEYLSDLLNQYRRTPDGSATFAVVQAEDEIAAMGYVVGASWAGARAATATSGPGLSLMAEFAGLSYFAEIPSVIIDVQRMGPSTGLPTRTCQGDILKAYFLSHGDCKHLLLIPGNVKECYEFATESFNMAERFQTLVLMMSDLDLGMNNWVSPAFKVPEKPMDRGKVLTAEDLNKLEKFERYRDVDGDGIPYRTLPGTNHPNAAFFTRGTGHTAAATYSEKPADWQYNMDRLRKKFDTARREMPQPILEVEESSDEGVIAYGSSDMAIKEALHHLKEGHGRKLSYLRVRALPASPEIEKFIASKKIVYIVEQNRDGQLSTILRGDFPEHAAKMRSVLHYNGMPLDAETVEKAILFYKK